MCVHDAQRTKPRFPNLPRYGLVSVYSTSDVEAMRVISLTGEVLAGWVSLPADWGLDEPEEDRGELMPPLIGC